MPARPALLAVLGALALAGCGPAEDEPPAGPTAADPEPTAPPRARRPRAVEPEAGRVPDGGPEDEHPIYRRPPADDSASGERAPEGPDRRLARDMERFGARPAPRRAVALPNGVALPPLESPPEVRAIVEAGNVIARAPYKWGGGHGRWQDKGYDCSGSVSFALASAGLLEAPLDSGRLMRWGKPGKGRWVTVYSNPGHVYLVVAGIRFDTSGQRTTGSRWQSSMRPGGGYVARHPEGL